MADPKIIGKSVHRPLTLVRDTSLQDRLNKALGEAPLPEGGFWALATVEVPDSDGDVVLVDGIDWSAYHSPPANYLNLLASHTMADCLSGAPASVGRIERFIKTTTTVAGREVPCLAFYATWALNQDGQPIDELVRKFKERYETGYASGFSVGMRIQDYEPIGERGCLYTRTQLLEISCVGIPANPHALLLRSLDTGEPTEAGRQLTRLADLAAKQSQVLDQLFARSGGLEQVLAKVAAIAGRLDDLECALAAATAPRTRGEKSLSPADADRLLKSLRAGFATA